MSKYLKFLNEENCTSDDNVDDNVYNSIESILTLGMMSKHKHFSLTILIILYGLS